MLLYHVKAFNWRFVSPSCSAFRQWARLFKHFQIDSSQWCVHVSQRCLQVFKRLVVWQYLWKLDLKDLWRLQHIWKGVPDFPKSLRHFKAFFYSWDLLFLFQLIPHFSNEHTFVLRHFESSFLGAIWWLALYLMRILNLRLWWLRPFHQELRLYLILPGLLKDLYNILLRVGLRDKSILVIINNFGLRQQAMLKKIKPELRWSFVLKPIPHFWRRSFLKDALCLRIGVLYNEF